jgi:hypothetical protein
MIIFSFARDAIGGLALVSATCFTFSAKLSFRPRASLTTQGEHALSENALYIFEELIARNGE